jgi:hypothetical protein
MRIEDVFRVLHDGIENNYRRRLRCYLTRHPVSNWVVASDYVIGDKTRYKDAFCYTIYPIANDLTATQREIREKIPRDLKSTSVITDSIVECIRSDERFSFCFVVDKGQGFFNDAEDVRSSIGLTLETVKNRKNWDAQAAALRRLNQTAKAKSFNFQLFSNTILASLFAAIVAMFITKFGKAKYIHWFSDRDSMVTSYRKVAYDLLGTHFYQACYECGINYESIELGIGDMTVSPWYDEFVRIPDFLAGALSAFDPETLGVASQKHSDVLTNVISDASQIGVIYIEVRRNAFSCRPALLSRIT